MFWLTLGYYAVCTLVALAIAVPVGKWLYTEDERVLTRRLRAGHAAQVYAKYGHDEIASLLTDYSSGAYVDCLKNFDDYVTAVFKDDSTLVAEINRVFARTLDAQLATPAGLALVQAKVTMPAAPTAPIAP